MCLGGGGGGEWGVGEGEERGIFSSSLVLMLK